MANRTYSPEEIAARGEAIYREQIRSLVETTEKGKFVIIDIETGDYEIDAKDVTATARSCWSDGLMRVTYAVRIVIYRAQRTCIGV